MLPTIDYRWSLLLSAAALCCVLPACGDDSSTPGSDAGASGKGGAAAVGGKGGAGGAGGTGGVGGKGDAGKGGAGAPADGGKGGAAADGGKGGSGGEVGAELPQLDAPLKPGDVSGVDVTLAVRTDKPLHWIAAEIYGTNGAPDIARNRQTVVRSGGNRMTAYNWETNASNAGSDYMFQNDDYLSNSNDPAKPILDGISEAASHEAAAIVTIPNVDYVAGDKKGGGDVRNSGSDYLAQRFKQNKPQKNAAFGAPDTGDGVVYEDEFVAYLKSHVPSGARVLFSMDNEPDLWAATHAEVHPDKLTYAELWMRNRDFASAAKAVWSDAMVLGFVSYGFNGYVTLQDAPDANKRDFIEWYLDQAKAEETKRGSRLIDYLDLHWYPEAQGGGVRITEASTAAATVTAREQAPRSLWDESYSEQSWIHDYFNGPIKLLPRLHDKIDNHYPDTKLAFTEWNYGGGGHISGAIACADVLGVFGREGVGLATYWPLNSDESYAYAALRAYRNYDGAGGQFGDVSLDAQSSDVEHVTVYASLLASDSDRVVIVAINKDSAAKNVGLTLAHPSKFKSVSRYQITSAAADVMSQPAQDSSADNAWKLMLPAQSVTVLVPQR